MVLENFNEAFMGATTLGMGEVCMSKKHGQEPSDISKDQ